MLKRFLIIFPYYVLILISLSSCDNLGGRQGNTTISGTFTQFPGKMVTLSEIEIRKTISIDTVTLAEDGEFRFRFNKDSASMYLLKVDNRNYITLVLDKEGKVEVFSDNPYIRDGYTVEGSEASSRLAEFESDLEKNKEVIDSLILRFNQGQARFSNSSVQLQMDEKYQKTFDEQVSLSRKFIQDNCSSLASLLVLDKRFGMRKILDEVIDADYYIMVDSCLAEKYPGNKHQIAFNKRIQTIVQRKAVKDHRDMLLSVGKKAPDITLEDPAGKSVSLYSYLGKKTIIYFWASWDKKSRKANMEMKRIYSMFHPKGLEIYAISLESYKETWMSAIQADNLPWTNVTDYLNIQSGAVGLFNVPNEFPYFFFLNEDMEIIYKGNNFVRLLEELDKSLN